MTCRVEQKCKEQEKKILELEKKLDEKTEEIRQLFVEAKK